MHEDLEGLGQGRVGNISVILVELDAGEQILSWRDQFPQTVYQRGFTHAGIARDQDELGFLAGPDMLECIQKNSASLLPSI